MNQLTKIVGFEKRLEKHILEGLPVTILNYDQAQKKIKTELPKDYSPSKYNFLAIIEGDDPEFDQVFEEWVKGANLPINYESEDHNVLVITD